MKHGSFQTGIRLLPLLIICICLLCACTRTPGVVIKKPSAGAVSKEGKTVVFKASVTAAEGMISQIIWISSIDGEIWKKTYDSPSADVDMSFTSSALSRGLHTIYCYAYGNNGFIGIDSTTLTVGEKSGAESLFVLIASPRNNQQFNAGDSITFCGVAADPAEGNLNGDSLVWSSDIDQQIGTGNELTSDRLSAGTHAITLAATNSQGVKQTAAVTISIAGSEQTTTTTAPGTTTSTEGSNTTTTTAGPGNTTTTSVAGVTTTTTIPGTTTTSISEYCSEDEPILCVDLDYSADQYWCCEEGTICGKVSLDNEGNPYGTCLPGGGSTTTTVPTGGSTTTTTSVPSVETTLYLSPDPASDILFYIHHKDNTMVYYKGFTTAGNMKLNHVSFDDGSAIIFNNDFIPVQWITDGLTAAVYTVDGEPFDPNNAYHEIALGEELKSFTADIYPSNLAGILTQMKAKTGITFQDAADFLNNYSIGSFSDLTVRAKQAGSDQARFIAASVGFSAAAAYLSIDNAVFDPPQASGIAPLSNPAADYLVRFAVSLLASKFNGQYGPQPPTDPSDPGVIAYLCRGQSSISLICHYMFFKAKCNPNGTCEASGACVSLCLTSMRCFTGICAKTVLSSQSAEDFKNHFFD
jgi:hypothetical protein